MHKVQTFACLNLQAKSGDIKGWRRRDHLSAAETQAVPRQASELGEWQLLRISASHWHGLVCDAAMRMKSYEASAPVLFRPSQHQARRPWRRSAACGMARRPACPTHEASLHRTEQKRLLDLLQTLSLFPSSSSLTPWD